MKTDHFFTIGQRHVISGTPCEDYAMSGDLYTGSHKFAVISDGCSGAKSKTDIGARLWCLAFERTLNSLDSNRIFMDFDFSDILIAEYQDKRICTNVTDEYASIVGMIATEDNAQIFMMGDGGYGIQYKNGNYVLVEVVWEDNKPFYPIYRTYDYDQYEVLSFNFRGSRNKPVKVITREFVPIVKSLNNINFNLLNKDNFNMIKEETTNHSFEEFENGYTKIFNIKEEEISAISIFSDGLWSVDNRTLNQTINDVFITNANEKTFVKDSMLETLSVWQKRGVMPTDDFSMANIFW